jgi:hypothetical protein
MGTVCSCACRDDHNQKIMTRKIDVLHKNDFENLEPNTCRLTSVFSCKIDTFRKGVGLKTLLKQENTNGVQYK